jgi:hypothetical protein
MMNSRRREAGCVSTLQQETFNSRSSQGARISYSNLWKTLCMSIAHQVMLTNLPSWCARTKWYQWRGVCMSACQQTALRTQRSFTKDSNWPRGVHVSSVSEDSQQHIASGPAIKLALMCGLLSVRCALRDSRMMRSAVVFTMLRSRIHVKTGAVTQMTRWETHQLDELPVVQNTVTLYALCRLPDSSTTLNKIIKLECM